LAMSAATWRAWLLPAKPANAVVAACVGDFHPGIGLLEVRHNLAML
jgi:hypothetical protein